MMKKPKISPQYGGYAYVYGANPSTDVLNIARYRFDKQAEQCGLTPDDIYMLPARLLYLVQLDDCDTTYVPEEVAREIDQMNDPCTLLAWKSK